MEPVRTAQQSEDYVFQIPAPPRILLPPPPTGDSIVDLLELPAPNIFPSTIAEAQLRLYGPAESTWAYHKRQAAQIILPFLALGPMTVTKDIEWLEAMGIVMALGIRQGIGRVLEGALKRCSDQGIETHSVSIASHEELVSVYPRTAQLIADSLRRSLQSTGKAGRVLVFCESGNERSAAVAAAFIMACHTGVDYIKAMQMCQIRRFCIHFDDSIKRSLQSYWDILCAQRALGRADSYGFVADLPVDQTGTAERDRKRGLSEEMDIEGRDVNGDAERFRDRSTAPFRESSFTWE